MEDIYVYEGTNVLINKRNIKNNEELDQFENAMTSLAIININRNFEFNDLNDIYRIHELLFCLKLLIHKNTKQLRIMD